MIRQICTNKRNTLIHFGRLYLHADFPAGMEPDTAALNFMFDGSL
jgi:hypothetical protein